VERCSVVAFLSDCIVLVCWDAGGERKALTDVMGQGGDLFDLFRVKIEDSYQVLDVCWVCFGRVAMIEGGLAAHWVSHW